MDLVREYVSCMDEMSQIHDFSKQKIEFLGRLREHEMDIQESFPNDAILVLSERIDEAVIQIRKDNENLPRLVNDLKASLDVVNISSPYIVSFPDSFCTVLPIADNRTE